jgi:hypothetical protein
MMMKKKGYAKGGLKPAPNKGAASLPKKVRNQMGFMNQGGMAKKKKGYAKGGAMIKKKAYAKGGKVAMYNQGGMVKSTGTMNTGVKTAKNTYK